MNQKVMANISLFVTVVNSGSFSAAANRLGLSKPSVSRRITALELALTTPLIKRTTRQLSLTEVGGCVVGLAQSLMLYNGTMNEAHR